MVHYAERFKDNFVTSFQERTRDKEVLAKRYVREWMLQEDSSSIGSADVVKRAKYSTLIWTHSLIFHPI